MKRKILCMILSCIMVMSLYVPAGMVSAADITSGEPLAQNTTPHTSSNKASYYASYQNGIAGAKCIAMETVFTPKSDTYMIMQMHSSGPASLSGTRYVYAKEGKLGKGTSTILTPEITYAAGTEYKLLYELNYTTGYYRITLTPTTGGTSQVFADKDSSYIKDDTYLKSVVYFGWRPETDGIEFKSVKVWVSDDAELVVPDKTVIDEDFDDLVGSSAADWNGYNVENVDGDGALVVPKNNTGAEARLLIPNFSENHYGITTSFSFKSTINNPWLIYSVPTETNYSWSNSYVRFLEFNEGKVYFFLKDVGDFEINKDTWYHVNLRNHFDTGLTQLEISYEKDGETVEKRFEKVCTNAANYDKEALKASFVVANDCTVYLDDINMYALEQKDVYPLCDIKAYSDADLSAGASVTMSCNSIVEHSIMLAVAEYDNGELVGISLSSQTTPCADEFTLTTDKPTSGNFKTFLWFDMIPLEIPTAQ